jgi:chemotaxis protein histidine kinase CheA
MDSAENTQEGRFERVREGSAEDAANQILNMWDSQEQTASEETDTPVDEEVVEETEEAEEVEEEAPEEEGQAEEETEEEVAEEEEEETEIVAEEDLMYTIKVDGEELEVGIDELKNGYQRQADYTRKSQALAEQRKETEQIQSERMRLEQERQMYANGLQMLQEQQSAKLKDFDNVDWEGLKTEDPYQYMIKKDEYRDAQERITNLVQEQQAVQQEQTQQAQQARAHFVQQEYSRLIEALPEWNDNKSTIKKDVQDYAISAGFLPEEVNQLADHRSILVIKKAMEYDKLTTKVAPKKKAVKKVPKVQKSGRGNSKEDVAAEAIKKKRARLQKSGKQHDAASVFYDML